MPVNKSKSTVLVCTTDFFSESRQMEEPMSAERTRYNITAPNPFAEIHVAVYI